MARPAYSHRFLGIRGLNGTAIYVVPAGFRAVVRDVDAYNGGGLVNTSIFVEGHAGQTFAYALYTAPLPAMIYNWRGRQILETGESLTVTSTGAWDVTISGYLLTP